MTSIGTSTNNQEGYPYPLTDDVDLQILSRFDAKKVHQVSQVCKRWLSLLEPASEVIFYRDFMFCGEQEWKEHAGDPGPHPRISYKDALKDVAVFSEKWPADWDRKMGCLIIKDILPLGETDKSKRIPATPINLGKLLASKIGAFGTQLPGYTSFCPKALAQFGNRAVQESYIVYSMPELIPDSVGKHYKNQLPMVKKFGGEVPESIENITLKYMKLLCTKENILNSIQYSAIRDRALCAESVDGAQVHIIFRTIRGTKYDARGIAVASNDHTADYSGIFALRRFKAIKSPN